MSMLIKTLAAVAAGTLLAAGAFAQSAREIRGPPPYVAIDNEAPPKLIVDRPLPEGLAQGVFWAQYRVENIRILPDRNGGRSRSGPASYRDTPKSGNVKGYQMPAPGAQRTAK